MRLANKMNLTVKQEQKAIAAATGMRYDAII
jgi:hypothetical protein